MKLKVEMLYKIYQGQDRELNNNLVWIQVESQKWIKKQEVLPIIIIQILQCQMFLTIMEGRKMMMKKDQTILEDQVKKDQELQEKKLLA